MCGIVVSTEQPRPLYSGRTGYTHDQQRHACWEQGQNLCDCPPGECELKQLMAQEFIAPPLVLLRPW